MQSTKSTEAQNKTLEDQLREMGLYFIAPFFLAYALFHFAPQMLTIYNSFF